MSNNVLSAGVYENIIDDTIVVDGQSEIVAAGIVLTAKRGPITPTIVTSNTQLLSLYGLPSRDNPALYSALRFMREGSLMTVTRVVTDAVAASGDLMLLTESHVKITAANPGTWGNAITVHFGSVLGEGEDIFAVVVRENGLDVERFEVSRDPEARDGYGRNQYIEDVINGRSRYIRVEDNPSIVEEYDQLQYVTLAGGLDDTIAPTDAIINAAWDEYVKEDEYNVQILINGGWVTETVQQKMNEVASKRTNCRAILDVPFDAVDDVAAMVAWRDLVGIDSYHSAMYGGWIRVYDQYSDRNVLLPPSGDVAAAYARTFRDYNYWDAPAGANRGVIDALAVSKIFTEAERDLLYVNGINPVTTYGGMNAVIWGQKSMQRVKSALDRMNVVNNVKWLTQSMKGSLHPFVFEANTRFVRDNINYILTTFLDGVKSQGGLYAFAVDTEKANTPDVIDNNQLIINVFVQPVRTAEMIRLNITVSPTGIELDAG